MAPFFSAICLSYARTARLRDAVYCFQQQDYLGEKELLIFNSCPEQTIVCDLPGVRVINCKERPKTLGECRNLAIESANGTHMLVWDDDDLYLPNHMRNFAENWKEDWEWCWLDKQIYAERFRPKNISQGTYNVFAFTKRAWLLVGGYSHMDCGEDNAICSKISSALPGGRVDIPRRKISFIYSWGNGIDHISGAANKEHDWAGAYTRVARTAGRNMRNRLEPSGTVKIELGQEPEAFALARHYIDTPEIAENSVCVVELGRYGDIINILPVCQHIANTYGKPYVMVSREFQSLLDGVSYVIPYPVDIEYGQLRDAIKQARFLFKHVLVAQIWGHNWQQERKTVSFNRESWRMTGFASQFDNRTWTPLFDLRDREREKQVIQKFGISGAAPVVLVNLTSSASSPFKSGERILHRLTAGLPDCVIIDTATIRAPFLYDMLGCMDAASVLVSIDTALLHLAASSSVPVVGLVNPVPWLGSEMRFDAVARITYTEAEANPDVVIRAVRDALAAPRRVVNHLPIEPAHEPVIYHATERHTEVERTPEFQRKLRARQSWDALYTGGVVSRQYWNYKRDALQIGDKRQLPYLKDVLEFAMEGAKDWDIIMWTNDDTWIHPKLIALLKYHCSIYGACSAQRCEIFRSGVHRMVPDAAPESFIQSGGLHMGRDMFAFRVDWLKREWNEMPDFLLGASEFDLAVAALIRKRAGLVTTKDSLVDTIWPAEIPKGYILHEYHKALWTAKDNVNTAPSQLHNRRLFRNWSEAEHFGFKFHPQDNCLIA